MKTIILFGTLFLIISLSCNRQNNSRKSNQTDQVVENSDKDTEIIWNSNDSSYFGNIFSKFISYKSVFKRHITGAFFDNDTFRIILDANSQKEINTILLNQYSLKDIMLKYKMFDIDSIIESSVTIYKLKFHNSFVAIRYSDNPLIIIGTIKDKEIDLNYNFKIGITRNEFYKAIFNTDRIDNFNKISMFSVGDLLGEYKTKYVFRNDSLIEVKTEIIDHWAIEKFKLDR